MTPTLSALRRFLADDDGPTAVEYAVMLMLVFLACLLTIQSIGLALRDSLQDSSQEIHNAMSSTR